MKLWKRNKSERLNLRLNTKEKDTTLIQQEIYLGGKKRRFPPWTMPLVFSLLVLFLILWLLPKIFGEPKQVITEKNLVVAKEETPLAAGDFAVPKLGEIPLFIEPKSNVKRISSALYGERLSVKKVTDDGFVQVETSDGFQGWCRRADISSDVSVLDEDLYRDRLIVLSAYKRVMSHTMGGYPVIKAPLGTILHADYESGNIYRILLPNGAYGWANGTGLINLDAESETSNISKGALFVSLAMNFHRSPSLPGGMSKDGTDMAGVIFISARANGLDLPRNLQKQAQLGEEVEFIREVETGLVRVNLLLPGDVLFFHSESDKNEISHAAIILEEGQALTAIVNDSILQIRNLQKEEDLLSRLVTVRRYFP